MKTCETCGDRYTPKKLPLERDTLRHEKVCSECLWQELTEELDHEDWMFGGSTPGDYD